MGIAVVAFACFGAVVPFAVIILVIILLAAIFFA